MRGLLRRHPVVGIIGARQVGKTTLARTRHPDLFNVLRVLADRPRHPCRFLVLGSTDPELLKQTAETLAGRIAYHQLSGFASSALK